MYHFYCTIYLMKFERKLIMSELIFRYRDDYPEMCPPKDAQPPFNLNLYRICKSQKGYKTLIIKDFEPVWENKKRKFPKYQECGAKAISFNSDLNSLENLIQDHPNIGNRIVKFKLNESCGLVKITNKNHYNLWDLMQPDILTAIGNEWKEVF